METQGLMWICRVVTDRNPKRTALEWAEEIAKADKLALRLAKMTIDNPSLEMERVAEALLYSRKATNR